MVQHKKLLLDESNTQELKSWHEPLGQHSSNPGSQLSICSISILLSQLFNYFIIVSSDTC